MQAINTLRLTFNSLDEWNYYVDKNKKMMDNIWYWHESLGNQNQQILLPGICEICEAQTKFSVWPHPMQGDCEKLPFNYQTDWWQGTLCDCGLSNLERAALRIFYEEKIHLDQVYHVGHFSKFRHWLSERIPNLVSSQYFPGRSPGELVEGVRNEDLANLSFDDESFNSLICMEILEHIPNYQSALFEMSRILKVEGRAILSFPWVGSARVYNNQIRAEMQSDGTVKHLMSPEYHGDPADNQGILSFRSFGWEILDELRAAGFSRVTAEFIFGPLHGYMTLINPIIVAVK